MFDRKIVDQIVKDYSTKRVPFKFRRSRLEFALSHAVFSSNRIDVGSVLLLKQLTSTFPDFKPQNILDLGSGVGTIGTAAAAYYTDAEYILQDRSAFAAAFSQYNYTKNLKSKAEFLCGPFFSNIEKNFDLILSNIPAKAGNPVISELIHNSLTRLTDNGIFAFVIVEPLADFAMECLKENDAEVKHTFYNEDYLIALCERKSKMEFKPVEYGRKVLDFECAGVKYVMKTSYNIPEFDSTGFYTNSAAKLIQKSALSRNSEENTLFISPGQGHLPVIFKKTIDCKNITLASDDSLSLLTTEQNLKLNSPTTEIKNIQTPALYFAERKENYSFICAEIQNIPESRHFEVLARQITEASSENARVILYGKTVHVQKLTNIMKDFSLKVFKKTRGYKIVLLERK
jgi:ribosomal protein L11 methylase PrmA